jgi:hypothetical protein
MNNMHLHKRKNKSIPMQTPNGTSGLTTANAQVTDVEANAPYEEEIETPRMSMLLSLVVLAVVTAVSAIPPNTDDIT